MAFNFAEIIAAETKKQEDAARNSSSGGGIGFKTVYPFANGRLELKFIGNEPSGLLYRELFFHEYWADNKKHNVPCLHQMYGMECPICKMIDNIQNTLDNNDVWKKYGVKTRGIMFAKLLNHTPDNYFGDTKNPPKPGDIVLFMFPKSVSTELRKLIIEFGDEIDTLFTENTTRNVTLKIGTQANGFPEYTFFVKNNSTTLCIGEDGNPDQAAFNEFMSKMPNLKEVRFPKEPNEDIMKTHRTVTEEMSRNYFGKEAVSNSFATASPMGNPQAASINQPVASAPVESVNVSNSSVSMPIESSTENIPSTTVTANVPPSDSTSDKGTKPPCFGNNEYNEKCAACPWDNECV